MFKNIDWMAISKVTGIGLSGVIAYYGTINGSNANVIYFIIIFLILIVLAIYEWNTQKKEKITMKMCRLSAFIKYFYDQSQFPHSCNVKIVIHKKLDEKQYIQYIDYYPNGYGKDRKFLIKEGLVSFAFENGEGEFSENFYTNEEKKDKLINIYGYDVKGAKEQINDGEKSYYCRPIMKNEKVWGVLYLKALKVETFPSQEELENSWISQETQILINLIQDEIAKS